MLGVAHSIAVAFCFLCTCKDIAGNLPNFCSLRTPKAGYVAANFILDLFLLEYLGVCCFAEKNQSDTVEGTIPRGKLRL